MSQASSQFTIAYLAQGKIRIKTGDAPPRTVDSVYGNSLREKAVRAQQRHSWKSQGDSSPLGAALWGNKAAMQSDVPIMITSVCASKETGGLIYSLESGTLCALLELGQLGAEEKRIWNDHRTKVRHVTVSPETGDMVFSIIHENGTANIGVKLAGNSGVQELTEGDSFDTAPRWIPGGGKKMVFQSAGVGRNRTGQFLAYGPFNIQQLDAETGEMTTLAEDKNFDFLAPQFLPDGAMLCIRRPYAEHEKIHPVRTIKEILLIPFRLVYAIFQYFNFFSAIYTGRKLTSAGGPKGREMDMKQMMIWGNLVRAQQRDLEGDEAADLVPKSWELHRRGANGDTKVLAGGVLAYDVAPDGTIVFTNGNAVFVLHADGRKEQILKERMIEQVFFVPA